MDEYIEREGLINNRPEGRNPKQFGKEEYNKGWNDCRSAFYALIDDMPAADVAPVRRGRWNESQRLYYGAKQYECSLCWAEAFWDKHRITEKYPCCHNCGAKMDLEV